MGVIPGLYRIVEDYRVTAEKNVSCTFRFRVQGCMFGT